MNAKSIFASKTFWFAVLTAAGSAAWPFLKDYVTPEQAGLIVAAANIVLRFVTTQPVTVLSGK